MKPSSTFDASPLDSWSDTRSRCQMIRGNLELEERILVELTNTGEIKFSIEIFMLPPPRFFINYHFLNNKRSPNAHFANGHFTDKKVENIFFKNFWNKSNTREYNQIKFYLGIISNNKLCNQIKYQHIKWILWIIGRKISIFKMPIL